MLRDEPDLPASEIKKPDYMRALDVYLKIARDLLFIIKVNELPSIKMGIDMFGKYVNSLSRHASRPNPLSEEALSRTLHSLITVVYYEKLIELRIYLYHDELTDYHKEKTALTLVTLPTSTNSEMANLITNIVNVTLEATRMPHDLGKVARSNWQQQMMSVISMLLIAGNDRQRAANNGELHQDLRNGLSCMLFKCERNNSLLDSYANDLNILVLERLVGWYQNIESLKSKTSDELEVHQLDIFRVIFKTMSGCMNMDGMPKLKELYQSTRRNLMNFDTNNPAECVDFYRLSIARMTEYARKFLTTLELTCYERNIDAPQTRERQQLLTNALNRYYLQNVMLRLYLQTGYVTIQDEKLVKQFEDELNITGKIFSALLLDAQPRKKSDAIRYNKLWFRTQMTLAHDKDTLERAIDYGLESEERSALVSVYLVSRLRSMINSVRKDDLIERNIIFVYLLVDLAIMKEKIANIHKNKQAYLYQMMIDLYYIGVRFASNPKEIALIADAPMLAFMFSLPEKTNRCDMNTFLLSAHTTNISSSYSNRVGNNVHEMKRELQNIESEFNFVRKALAKAIARLKSERMGGMNYLVQQDFITDALLVASSQDNQESLQTKIGEYYYKLLSAASQDVIVVVELTKDLYDNLTELSTKKISAVVSIPVLKRDRKKEIEDSFSPVAPVSNAKNTQLIQRRNKQKGVSVDTKPVNRYAPTPPALHLDYVDFEKFYQHNDVNIRAYLEPILLDARRREVERYFALLHLTRCLESSKDQTLAEVLIDWADYVLRNARQFFPSGSEFRQNQKYVYTVLARFEKVYEIIKEKPVVVSVPAKPIISDNHHGIFKPANSKKKTYQPEKQPQVAMPSKPDLQTMLDEQRPRNQKKPLVFPFRSYQTDLLAFLQKRNHRTFVHGSSILSLIRGVKVNDIDLLCYADSLELQILFSDDVIRKQFNISWSMIDERNRQIFIIHFNNATDDASSKLEIVCRGVMSDDDMLKDMKGLLASYYISNMLCDPYNGQLFDPYHQYDSIAHWHKFVNLLNDPDPVMFFNQSPMRMIELVIRMAFFQSQGKPFVTNNALRKGITSNQHRLIFNPDEIETQITSIKFDKLVLRRHAKESFDELVAYDLLRVIMPAFGSMDQNQLDEVRKVIADFDQYINETYESDLSDQELAYNRIEFIARLVICYMDVYQLTDSLSRNVQAFNLKVDKILTGFNLRKLHDLTESIKTRAYTRITQGSNVININTCNF